jgi:hypothetical protein
VFFPYRKQAPSTSGPYWGDYSNAKAIDHLIDVFRRIYSRYEIDFSPVETRIREDFRLHKTARFNVTDNLNQFNLRVKADIYSETFTVTFFMDVPVLEKADVLKQGGVDGLVEHWRRWINEVDAKLNRQEFGGKFCISPFGVRSTSSTIFLLAGMKVEVCSEIFVAS